LIDDVKKFNLEEIQFLIIIPAGVMNVFRGLANIFPNSSTIPTLILLADP